MNILNFIPSSSKESKTKIQIYNDMFENETINFTYNEFVNYLKEERIKWTPILWNSWGIFISYNKEDIINHLKKIDNSIKWFNIGMTKIKKSLQKHDWSFHLF